MPRSPRTSPGLCLAALGALLACPLAVTAAEPEPEPSGAYLRFVRAQAGALRSGGAPPRSLDDWAARKAAVRKGLLDAWGGFPADPCPLEPVVLGTLKRDGYRVERLTFQTRPGVRMTANAYVPDAPGKRPALLMVHGHWRGAKQDPVVQSRCIGAAKLGFFVLAVDAFGAGERGVGKALGEYHGGMTGATLLPVGMPLSGVQVYENTRAVDYLRTRPEVDGEKVGVTGASGGGNQSMYAGAWDERLKASAPVCSVGNYAAYLGAACCMCEVVPGALKFTEESGVLGLTAPRALLVVNASRDAPQFSVAEAKTSLAAAEPVFRLFGRGANLRQAVFESGHDYSRPMREAVYGWMTLHLKGEGDGSPVAEPEIKTEDPEDLRCYPGETRPADFMTLPRFAAERARAALADATEPADATAWRAASESLRASLIETVFGGFPALPPPAPRVEAAGDGKARLVRFEPEPGLWLTARVEAAADRAAPLALVLNLEGGEKAAASAVAAEFRRGGWGLVTLDLRATGRLAPPSDGVGPAPDHNSAEWGLWVGRPLLGQWAIDVRRLLDALTLTDGPLPSKVVVVGEGPAGLVALASGATDPRVSSVAAVGSLASYVSDAPYAGQRLGVMAPGILRAVGDVPRLAALCAPRRVVIAGAVAGAGAALTSPQIKSAYAPAARVWSFLNAPDALTLSESTDPAAVVRALR